MHRGQHTAAVLGSAQGTLDQCSTAVRDGCKEVRASMSLRLTHACMYVLSLISP